MHSSSFMLKIKCPSKYKRPHWEGTSLRHPQLENEPSHGKLG